jgi:putative chitinase
MNQHLFFKSVRASLFGGKLLQSQVDGMIAIANEFYKKGHTDARWLAYILATAYHETDKTFKGIEEYGRGKGKEYGKPHPETGKVYYGRGLVQLTWYENYEKMSVFLGVDLVNHPELALDVNIAAQIIIEGMTTGESYRGDFTNRHLAEYFNDEVTDPVEARRIINGKDKAKLIAGYYDLFLQALQ